MLMKQLSRALAITLFSGLLAPSYASAAEEQFMAVGLPFFPPYRAAIAHIDVQGNVVKGMLAPPPGDPRNAVPLNGTITNGVMDLTVNKGADSYQVQLKQDTRGEQRLWVETGIVPGIEDVLLFRPEDGFSHAALSLQRKNEAWCGLINGGLAVTLRASDLRNLAKPPADLAALNVVTVGEHDDVSIVKLEHVWSRLRLAAKTGRDVTFDIVVPVGSEAPVAEKIRSLPAVGGVHLPNLCRDMALAVIPSERVMDAGKLNDDKLKLYLEGALRRQLSGLTPDGGGKGGRKFELSNGKVQRTGNGLPLFTGTIIADAAITRGESGWDKFVLDVVPVTTAADAGDTISFLVTVRDVANARKTGAQIPAASAFSKEDDDDAAAIAYRLVTWMADAENTRCAFITTSGFNQPEEGFACDSLMLDDVVPDTED